MPLRVLIVDDQESFRATMTLVLAHADDLELVALADSGEAALALVDGGLEVDVAVIDVHMGGIDGALTADRLIAHHAEVTTVLTSTYAPDELPASVTSSDHPYLPKHELEPDRLVALWVEDHQQP